MCRLWKSENPSLTLADIEMGIMGTTRTY